jgi:hypothetical protein
MLTDGDEIDFAHVVQPVLDVADLAVMAATTWAKNYHPIRLKPSLPSILAIGAGVVQGSRGFVVCGNDPGSDAFIASSHDGYFWGEQANPKNFPLQGVAYSSLLGMWALVGLADGADAYVLTSSTGNAPYTERSNPANVDLNAVCTGPAGEFVAVGNPVAGQSYILRSLDGGTWAQQLCPVSASLFGITYAQAKYVAVGQSAILTSVNGATWISRAYPATTGYPRAVTYEAGASLWFVLTSAGEILRSPDAITWTKLPDGGIGATADARGIAADATGVIIATGSESTGILLSVDGGVTWESVCMPSGVANAANTALCAAFAHGRFIVAGKDGVVGLGRVR